MPVEPGRGQLHQRRGCAEIPVGPGRVDMAEVGGEDCDVCLDVASRAVEVYECADSEAMPEIVNPGMSGRGCNDGPDQLSEGRAYGAVVDGGADRGDEERARSRRWAEAIPTLGIAFQGRRG